MSDFNYSVMVINEAIEGYFDDTDDYDDLATAINSYFESEDQFVPMEEF